MRAQTEALAADGGGGLAVQLRTVTVLHVLRPVTFDLQTLHLAVEDADAAADRALALLHDLPAVTNSGRQRQ